MFGNAWVYDCMSIQQWHIVPCAPDIGAAAATGGAFLWLAINALSSFSLAACASQCWEVSCRHCFVRLSPHDRNPIIRLMAYTVGMIDHLAGNVYDVLT